MEQIERLNQDSFILQVITIFKTVEVKSFKEVLRMSLSV